jgi:hypothetical protein
VIIAISMTHRVPHPALTVQPGLKSTTDQSVYSLIPIINDFRLRALFAADVGLFRVDQERPVHIVVNGYILQYSDDVAFPRKVDRHKK